MEFRTELFTKPISRLIELSDKIMTLGSCFADNIGDKFQNNKFSVSKNPYGTVYNPISIHQLLTMAVRKTSPPTSGFLDRDGFSFHYDFPSTWGATSSALLKSKIERRTEEVHSFLSQAKNLIITYGSAWVYERHATNNIVTNCHKMPQQNFKKLLL